MKKYEFTGETKKAGISGDITVRKIRATVAFGAVKVGDLGGWVEQEKNLSQEDDAWVYGDAKVYGNAEVCDDAKVWGNAEVWGDAKVFGDAEVCDNAKVWGDAKVYGNAEVCDNAKVWDNAEIWGNAEVCDNAEIWGNAEVRDDAKVYGDAEVCGDAKVSTGNHLLVIGPIGSRNSFTTFFRDKEDEITVKCGCFIGKIDKFIGKVQKTHSDNRNALVYRAAVEVAKIHII